jgi:3-deoxy-D-manno-octulosonic-acid transferase
MENFRDVEELVLRHGAGVKVADIDSLETQLRRLIRDSGYRRFLGARCASVFAVERSSVEEHMELISQSLYESQVQDRPD